VTPWWESEPGRFEYELAELEAAGVSYEIDERARTAGVIVLNLTVTTGEGEVLRLVARFPDLYPYVRFELLAPELELDRHQNPIGKQLCLIGRDTGEWRTTDTLAAYIMDRLPLVLRGARGADADEVAALEEHQGEPFSDYYPYRDGHMLLVDGAWVVAPDVRGGLLVIGFNDRSGLRGTVLAVKDEHGRVIAEADLALRRLYPRQLEFRWVRCDGPIKEGDLNRFFDALYARDPLLRQPRWRSVNARNYDVVGVLFPEEQRWREQGDGWVFAVRSRPLGGASARVEHFLVRAGRAGKADMAERVPELRPLSERRVAVIGLGAIGATSAFELARSGVGELRVLDHDYVDPATTVRWPLGLTAAGKSKVESVADFISTNYPHTKVVPFEHRLGACRVTTAERRDDGQVLGELLEGADLVYDASAELGINHVLSDQAAARGLPYVCVSTTHGAWGGRLIRVRPGGLTEGCWMCHQWAINTGILPTPLADPRGEVQPAGCSDPTFTGAGFDVASVALAGVRLAASTLAAGAGGGYPDVNWDVAVISLRDGSGQLLVSPGWDTYPLARHPDCKNERAHSR
jgi:hypothetical protein